jgi:lipopolysaccharide/colanic/teichoic acid biosynthesis glycosyltransferase
MNNPQENNSTPYIALIALQKETFEALQSCNFKGYRLLNFATGIEFFSKWEREKLNVKAVLVESEILGPNGVTLLQTLQRKHFVNVPYFIITKNLAGNPLGVALKFGIADVFKLPIKPKVLETRVNFLTESWASLHNEEKANKVTTFKTPLIKRIFDVTFASCALLALSPIILIVILLLKLESKGPVFYYSLRVGTGYKIFKFYKFRSMFVNADKRLKDLKHLNQYASTTSDAEEELNNDSDEPLMCADCLRAGTKCQKPFFADDNQWCEKNFSELKKASAGSAFFKLKDDPRITKVGKVLRNTSIDELPQLWNVLIGDMSIVGNRPLPLYEAEKLTTDRYSLRFMAPAGITGLWQVEKRGKGEMSEDERLMLDNKYAENHSFANDIRLILRTIPALFQSESV